jgi:F0F1-type ATP synthase membrane subunit c/vacuolar-type H+-ATPase subunit K
LARVYQEQKPWKLLLGSLKQQTRSTIMFIIFAFIETLAIYGLLIAFMLIPKIK